MELVRGMWAAAIRGEDVAGIFAPDFRFVPPAILDDGASSYPSFKSFNLQLVARYPGARLGMSEFLPIPGGNVLGIGRLAVDGGPGGAPGFSSLQATVYEVRDGQITGAETFTDLELARDVAGLTADEWPDLERFADGTIVRSEPPAEA